LLILPVAATFAICILANLIAIAIRDQCLNLLDDACSAEKPESPRVMSGLTG
jgi:hypothetical protein